MLGCERENLESSLKIFYSIRSKKSRGYFFTNWKMAEEAKPVVHEFTEEQVEGKKEIFTIYRGPRIRAKIWHVKNSRMVSNSLIWLVRVSFHGLNALTLQDASVSTHWKNKSNCFWLVVMKKTCQRKKIWPLNQSTSMISSASCGVLLPLTLLAHMKTFTKAWR